VDNTARNVRDRCGSTGRVRQKRQRRHLSLALAGAERHILVVTIKLPVGRAGLPGSSVARSTRHSRQLRLGRPTGALRWGGGGGGARVANNIAAFRRDPKKVTIAGESAGGNSVCDHLIAPDRRTVRAAIIQSAPCQAQADVESGNGKSWTTRSRGLPQPRHHRACLRRLPATRLERPLGTTSSGTDGSPAR